MNETTTKSSKSCGENETLPRETVGEEINMLPYRPYVVNLKLPVATRSRRRRP